MCGRYFIDPDTDVEPLREIIAGMNRREGVRTGGEIFPSQTVPVVASGGAGSPLHIAAAFTEGKADAAIVAGMVHTGDWTIGQIKSFLSSSGIPVRRTW